MSTEIITEAQFLAADLRAKAETINSTIDLITQHEDSFNESTLEPRLLIGLEITKALAAFGMTNAQAGAIGGSVSRRDTLAEKEPNPLGFSAWIGREIPRLNRSTAYKYATAFRSLGIESDHATPAAIRAKIKDLRHHCGKNNLPMPTLSGLYKAGKPAQAEAMKALPAPGADPKTRLQDAREYWTLWREQGETFIKEGRLDDLDKQGLQELKEFNLWLRDRLTARLK